MLKLLIKIVCTYHVLLVLVSCSHRRTPLQVDVENDLVTVGAALDHITQSYILGCVEAYRAQNISQKYLVCRDRGLNHSKEVKILLEKPILEINTPNKKGEL